MSHAYIQGKLVLSGTPKINEPDKFSRIDYLPLKDLEHYPFSPDLKPLLPKLKGIVRD